MKVAIIYRSNKNLDRQLAQLKEKVDLFQAFPPATDLSTMWEFCEQNLDGSFDTIFCDLTCAGLIECKAQKKVVIKQAEGPLQDHVGRVADRANAMGLPVVIVRDCIAHHCELDGINPYEIGEGLNGWYQEKVLLVWQSLLADAGVPCEIVDKSVTLEVLVEKIVICDHHNHELFGRICSAKLLRENSYASLCSRYEELSEIASLMGLAE